MRTGWQCANRVAIYRVCEHGSNIECEQGGNIECVNRVALYGGTIVCEHGNIECSNMEAI